MHQAALLVAVHEQVEVIANVVDPAAVVTLRAVGDRESVHPACVTVMVFGLPVAPVPVIVMLPVRELQEVLVS